MQKEEITTKLGTPWSKCARIDKRTIKNMFWARVGPDKVPQHQNQK